MRKVVVFLPVLIQLLVFVPIASAQIDLIRPFMQREDVSDLFEQIVYIGAALFMLAIGIFVVTMRRNKPDIAKLRR